MKNVKVLFLKIFSNYFNTSNATDSVIVLSCLLIAVAILALIYLFYPFRPDFLFV